VLTGSVFEQNEGAGSDHLRAVSPYGLSKGMTTDVFRYYSTLFGFSLGKFVIPNPFGPFEEMRYTSSLVQSWNQKKTATVHVPLYVRDNIHVSLLARAYRFFVDRLASAPGFEKFNPSGYVETQGAFTARFAQEIGKRLGLECPYECLRQAEFSEPKVRINTDVLNFKELGWDEEWAWDDLANYYAQAFIRSNTQ
jgi:UDP-glucose 4-epimerase